MDKKDERKECRNTNPNQPIGQLVAEAKYNEELPNHRLLDIANNLQPRRTSSRSLAELRVAAERKRFNIFQQLRNPQAAYEPIGGVPSRRGFQSVKFGMADRAAKKHSEPEKQTQQLQAPSSIDQIAQSKDQAEDICRPARRMREKIETQDDSMGICTRCQSDNTAIAQSQTLFVSSEESDEHKMCSHCGFIPTLGRFSIGSEHQPKTSMGRK